MLFRTWAMRPFVFAVRDVSGSSVPPDPSSSLYSAQLSSVSRWDTISDPERAAKRSISSEYVLNADRRVWTADLSVSGSAERFQSSLFCPTFLQTGLSGWRNPKTQHFCSHVDGESAFFPKWRRHRPAPRRPITTTTTTADYMLVFVLQKIFSLSCNLLSL